MADFEERLDVLLLRAKEIQAHKAADSYDDIFKHQHEADVWMNDAQIFYNNFLQEHPLGNRLYTILFHRGSNAFSEAVACMESIESDRAFVDKMNGIPSVSVPKYQARTLPE